MKGLLFPFSNWTLISFHFLFCYFLFFHHFAHSLLSDFFRYFFNSRYGKAAISKERKKSARYEDVEDFPESCANDQVDAVVDYLINQGADINASDKYGMLYVLSCNKITRPEINSPAEIEMAFYQIIATRG